MPKSINRLVLIIFSRLIILAAFYKEMVLTLNTLPIFLGRGLSVLYILFSNISYLISILISILAVVAITTGSFYVFAIAVILSAFTCIKPCLPLIQIISFLVYLVVDTIMTSYRGLEYTSVKTRFIDIVKSFPIPLILILLSTIVTTLVTFAIVSIVNMSTTIPKSNPQLYTIMTSHITRIIVSLVGIIYAYNVARKVGEITAVFIMPSSKTALYELSNDEDINVMFTPIFRWLLYISLAAVLYTPVYTIVLDVLLIDLLKGLSDLMKNIISAITYVTLIVICRSLDIFSDPHLGVKRLVITSIALLILVYIAAVKLVFPYYGLGAITSPGFQELSEIIQKNYIDFSATVITLITTFSKLIGVVP
jgi:hypothetical protein